MIMAGQWDNAIAYQWTGPDNFISIERDNMIASASFSNAGMYTLSVMSPDDCETVESVQVQVPERPLPVHLINFDGFWNPKQKSNDLNWSTDFELNSDYFIIKRSSDQKYFEEIARVKAAGNTSKTVHYNLTDRQIEVDTKYTYTLTNVDLDGRKSDAGTITIQSGIGENFTSGIFPNPANASVNLLLNRDIESTVQIELYNSTGIRLLNYQLIDNTKNRNVLEGLMTEYIAGGVYFIKVTAETREEFHKLVIIK